MKAACNILRIVLACAAAASAPGCGDDGATRNPRVTDAVEAEIVSKWGKPLGELPADKIVLISPNNESITNEFTWAFVVDYALSHGRRVHVEWRQVGGGTTAILRYLRNVYDRAETTDIDIFWGGGQIVFQKLADEGLLSPMDLPAETIAHIPAKFGGVAFRDGNGLWCGSAVSGFGFIYNKPLLASAGIGPPRTWEDIAAPECFDMICLADPMQSGSAAMAYQMIVQSEPNWPAGWAKLLAVLGNAKRFLDSAGSAANAPALGEAPIATCIDFYGAIRVNEAPDMLEYVSPTGQTTFTPDPIAILKNPPNPRAAQAFARFVLSRRGQALWALKPGDPDGPVRNALGRQPIRTDVYDLYAGRFSPWATNPYAEGNEMDLDTEMLRVSFGVLRLLVRSAAIDNLSYLQAARERVIKSGFDEALLARFNQLPDNVATRKAVTETARLLKDKAREVRIASEWQEFFRDKYKWIAAARTP